MKDFWLNDYCTTLLKKIKNARCALLGFGVTGRAIIEFLFDIGAEKITVHDRKSAEELDGDATYRSQGIKFVSGEQYLDHIDADFIFRSPGIRDDHEGIVRAVENGAYLTSEMELFFELTPAVIIGITGSDGKTTTTTLCAKILEKKLEGKSGRVYLGGNIGTPLLPRVFEMTENDYAVVELSSFQLKTMKSSADRAVITNLSPNHLDWHTGMDEYIESKFNICCHKAMPRLVTNADNALTMKLTERVSRATLFSSTRTNYEEICPEGRNKAIFERDGEIILSDGTIERVMLKTADIKLVGRHNVENYMAAIGALDGLVSAENVREVARTFGGVEHRLEFVRTLDGVSYYNSSIDTSPTRTAAALSALSQKPIVICGGYDKHIPFDTLGDTLCQKAKCVVLTGATANAIKAAVEASAFRENSELVVVEETKFEDAVIRARAMASEGDIVILSPACASFDAFPNFAARGNTFKQIVNEMR